MIRGAPGMGGQRPDRAVGRVLPRLSPPHSTTMIGTKTSNNLFNTRMTLCMGSASSQIMVARRVRHKASPRVETEGLLAPILHLEGAVLHLEVLARPRAACERRPCAGRVAVDQGHHHLHVRLERVDTLDGGMVALVSTW
jgi:hypothetical protein